MRAVYDEIADWYEHEFLGTQDARASDPLEIDHCLRALLGPGGGVCLEVGCGTGVHAATVRELGWTPVGVDVSAGMLRHARGRLATARADAQRLPLRDDSLPAVISVMVHTDMPGYLAVVREAARVLRPGGKVGATHFPLPSLLHAFTSAGLTLDRFAEGGSPSPQVLAIRARKPAAPQ
jgi:ubiquinone/menaquinone biosynthesis C-methylase UbiE